MGGVFWYLGSFLEVFEDDTLQVFDDTMVKDLNLQKQHRCLKY